MFDHNIIKVDSYTMSIIQTFLYQMSMIFFYIFFIEFVFFILAMLKILEYIIIFFQHWNIIFSLHIYQEKFIDNQTYIYIYMPFKSFC